MTRVILVTASNLGPYHDARYSRMSETEVVLSVLKTPVEEHVRPWQQPGAGYQSIVWPDKAIAWPARLAYARELVARETPDLVMVVGYANPYGWAVSRACRRANVPCALYLVGWKDERPRNRLKELLKRHLCQRLYTHCVATGSRALDYALWLGFGAGRCHVVGNVVDNRHFGQAAHRLPRLPAFLCVSRLSPEKNLETLLRAFSAYLAAGGSWTLQMAGVGPEEQRLQCLAKELRIDERVSWLGWVGYEELPEVYAQAGAFVLPSLVEPWGLVVNEAMAAGCPVILSRQCGCVPELCIEGKTGFSFSPTDEAALADSMRRMQDLACGERARMGECGQRVVADLSPKSWAMKTAEAAMRIVKESGRMERKHGRQG